jgi:ligand-binding sensor domain-containing protein/signal transduction histidine kinase
MGDKINRGKKKPIVAKNLEGWQGTKWLFLAIWIVLIASISGEAEQYTFLNYTGNDGLSQLVSQVLFQDRDGYIWIGTQAGLNRFDGRHFEIYSITRGLSNDWVNAIIQDNQGTLWIGTNGGLSRLDTQGITNYADGLPHKHVLSLAVDSRGEIWCGTKNGLSRWNGLEFYNFSEKDGLPQTIIYDLLIDYDGRLWVATDLGLYYLDDDWFKSFPNPILKNQRIYKLVEDGDHRLWVSLDEAVLAFKDTKQVAKYASPDGIYGFPATALCAGRDSVIWVGTGSGLAMIRKAKVRFVTTSNGLPFHNVNFILEDRDGIIWLGGSGGVAKFLGRPFATFKKEDGLGSNNVRPILRDRHGFLWVGTFDGLSRFDGKKWSNFTTKDKLNHNHIWYLFEDSHGILWIGNQKGLNYFDGKRFRDVPEISRFGRVVSIIEDTSGALWCAVQNVGIFRRTPAGYELVQVRHQTFSNASLLADQQGNVWASGDYGLSRWNGKSWKTFTTKDGLSDNEPHFLCLDHQGYIWFGYHSSRGVTSYDGTKFRSYTTKDGLFNDAVYSLGVDQENNLWIGTARGVDRFDGRTFINYGTVEGYASNESNSAGFFADHDGTLWFGTAEGLSHYDPNYDLPIGKHPWIKIQQLLLGNDAVSTGDVVTVSHSRNDLLARVVVLTYLNEKRIDIRYRLSGYDEGWKPLKANEINYTNLPAGEFVLEIQGRTYMQDWSESTNASFVIRPPYWQTWWFGLFVTITFVALALSFSRYRVYKTESRNRRLEQEIAERTAELRQQKSQLETALKERKSAQESQAKLLKELESTNQELKDFAYVVSHDLKAPLRAIGSLADWILRDYRSKFNKDGKELFDLLIARVKRMHDLIEGVLRYSRAGINKEKKVRVNLNEVVSDAIEMISPPKRINVNVENKLPTIWLEKTRIQQVFENLIGNAIKYMDKPRGKVGIGCLTEDGYWKFYVKDNGPGIEEKYHEKIFKIFQTLNARDEFESTGVGLTLVKKIVEMYDGKIWIESQVGSGTTFFFTLPRQEIGKITDEN